MLKDFRLYKQIKEIQIYYKEIYQKDWNSIPPIRTENKVMVYYKDYLIWKTYMGSEKLNFLSKKIRNYYPFIRAILENLFLLRGIEIPQNFLESFFKLMEEKENEIFLFFLKNKK